MAKFIFDGPNKRVNLDPSAVVGGVATFSIEELWTEWVDWYLTADHSKYLPAFRTVGGDPIGGGQYVGKYLFMRNDLGWRGRPPADVDSIIRITGSFFGEDPNLPVMEAVSGRTTVLMVNHSALVTAMETTGTPAPTAAENAAAVVSAAQVTPIHADARRIRGQAIAGSGTESDPWGPA